MSNNGKSKVEDVRALIEHRHQDPLSYTADGALKMVDDETHWPNSPFIDLLRWYLNTTDAEIERFVRQWERWRATTKRQATT